MYAIRSYYDYSRILDYIQPDYIHVLKEGRIIKTAGPELVAQLEEHGYDAIEEAQ